MLKVGGGRSISSLLWYGVSVVLLITPTPFIKLNKVTVACFLANHVKFISWNQSYIVSVADLKIFAKTYFIKNVQGSMFLSVQCNTFQHYLLVKSKRLLHLFFVLQIAIHIDHPKDQRNHILLVFPQCC